MSGALRKSLITTGVGLLLVILSGQGLAAAPNSIDGVWRIAGQPDSLQVAGVGSIPFTRQGREAFADNRKRAAQGDRSFDPVNTGCASPGQPRLMLTAKRFVVFQRATMVTIVYEWNRLFRQIMVGPQLRNPFQSDRYKEFLAAQGYAEGRWEGDAFVVTTTGINGDKLLDGLLPNSDQLQIVEYLRRLDANTLENRIEFTDPVMFTRPWQATVRYERVADDAFPFPEDVCLDRLKGSAPVWP
jgi:hypothetical protein